MPKKEWILRIFFGTIVFSLSQFFPHLMQLTVLMSIFFTLLDIREKL